jgi:crotonobetainyl-CoA:carnitine CoA-transferase CaiB-like acyl-CoA transferase
VLGVTAALAHPHAQAREMVVTAQHATAGSLPLVGRPIKFPGSPQSPSTAPPTLGQHTAQVLQDELGYSEPEIAVLRRDGVIDRVTARVPG